MPLSLPPSFASSLSDLLRYAHLHGFNEGMHYTLARIQRDDSVPALSSDPPLSPEILDSQHMEHFLSALEKLLLDCHHHTPSSPLLTQPNRYIHICSICSKPIDGGTTIGTGDGSMSANGGKGSFAHATCYRDKRDQASATFPPPLDSQDQL